MDGVQDTSGDKSISEEKSKSVKKKNKDKTKDSSKKKRSWGKGSKKADRELTPQEKRTQEILELAKLPTPQKKKKRKRQRIITASIIGVSIIGICIFSGIAFAGQYSGSFTIQMYKGPDCDISLGYTPHFKDDEKTTFLYAEGLNRADVISCDDVSKYMNEKIYKIDVDKLSGANNLTSNWEGIDLRDPNDDGVIDYALCYTFYVKNNNKEEESRFQTTLNLINYKAPENVGAINPLEYLRIRIYKNSISKPNEHKFTTWGMLSDTGMGTVESQGPDNLDLRECIGKTSFVKKPSYQGGQLRKPDSSTNKENDGYCEPFSLSRDNEYRGPLIERRDSIAPEQTYRYTVLMWLEGDDPSCRGHRPENVTLDLQMIFKGE